MYAGLVQVYQTCMLVGTRVQNDMTAGKMQLLKTWEMAGCHCYRAGVSDINVCMHKFTDMTVG